MSAYEPHIHARIAQVQGATCTHRKTPYSRLVIWLSSVFPGTGRMVHGHTVDVGVHGCVEVRTCHEGG